MAKSKQQGPVKIWVAHKLPQATTLIHSQRLTVHNQIPIEVVKDKVVIKFLNTGRLVKVDAPAGGKTAEAPPAPDADQGDGNKTADQGGEDQGNKSKSPGRPK